MVSPDRSPSTHEVGQRAAGVSTGANHKHPEGTKYCLNPHTDVLSQSRPSTPESIRKWRKSNFIDPGKRVIHPAMIEDFPKGHEQDIVFGAGKIRNSSDCVEDLWGNDIDECESIKHEAREGKYLSAQKAPLGKSYSRGHNLPQFMTKNDYRHGVESAKTQHDAKSLLYPKTNNENDENERLSSVNSNYLKSHGSYQPGEQRKRNYNWPLDPETTVFGDKGKDATERGSGKGVFDALHMVIDDRSSSRPRSKHISTPEVVPFRKSKSSTSGGSAAECLGFARDKKFDDADDTTAQDLGKSVTPGFRNAVTQDVCVMIKIDEYKLFFLIKLFSLSAHDCMPECIIVLLILQQSFGCPSVRTDIPKYCRQSVADTQNYGDDVNAGYLLRPSQFSLLGLDEDEFHKPRTKEFIRDVFETCGYDTQSCNFDVTFESLSDHNGMVDIEKMRDAYNRWLMSTR
mmetsp:Transcript_27216/g.40733  ORF Transcript_27216/g.40733 Transcript_27216/m.40733 type:complete len:457 (-) Transcript_27216:70-1440(-)